MAENLVELGVLDEGVKHEENVEAFGAMAAPRVAFGADVAAAKNVKIEGGFEKALDDCVFVEAAQEAEIVDLIS